jgi:hypothetical protein
MFTITVKELKELIEESIFNRLFSKKQPDSNIPEPVVIGKYKPTKTDYLNMIKLKAKQHSNIINSKFPELKKFIDDVDSLPIGHLEQLFKAMKEKGLMS